jgi:ABC-2 type transport system permease protein
MKAVTDLPRNIFKINPIIVKEIRSRMRGPRAFITLTAMLLFMGGVMYAMLQIILAQSRYMNVLSPQVGQSLFAALSFLMLFMICAVTPAVTAGAISGEKEKQTYEMLMATPLSGTSILWGKLISALSYVFLLLFAGVPLASVVFLFGGVNPGDMVRVLLVLLVVAVTLGVLGLFMSSLFGRTGRATVASFIVVLAMTMGPLFLTVLVAAMQQGEPPRWILVPSPISALSAALASSMGSFSGREIFFVLGGIFNTGIAPLSQIGIPRPLYHYSLPLFVMLTVTLYLLTTRLIQPAHRWHIRRREALIGAGILLALAAVIAAGFFATASRYERAVNLNQQQVDRGFIEPIPPPPDAKSVLAVPVEVDPNGTVQSSAGEVNEEVMMPLDENHTAEIYAAIARRYYTVDHTFGSSAPKWEGLYLVMRTNDGVGDPDAERGDPVDLPDAVISGVAKRLNEDLPAKVMWVNTTESVQANPENGTYDNGRSAMVVFGNIYPQKDGTVHVSASLYFSSLGATGRTYILTNENGYWEIIGDTGVVWMS